MLVGKRSLSEYVARQRFFCHEHRFFSSELLSLYADKTKQKYFCDDSQQRKALLELVRLQDQLQNYQASRKQAPRSLISRIFSPTSNANLHRPKGIYIYGDVGRGKTMLLDLFYETIKLDQKKRLHFHQFMKDIHQMAHRLKTIENLSGDVILTRLAMITIEKSWLLCLDEFQVVDIADAMILRGLFTKLFEQGLIIVTTSNRPPEDLYKNGIQRKNFLPFIDLLLQNCQVLNLNSSMDYRTLGEQLTEVTQQRYFHPLNSQTRQSIIELFGKYTSYREPTKEKLESFGRPIYINESVDGVARFSFQELCGSLLSPADYGEIAKRFHTIFIVDIPRMGLKEKNEVRRFISMMDAFYDQRVNLICSADASPRELFNIKIEQTLSDAERNLMDNLSLDSSVTHALFDGEEEQFAFQRALSRLVEMQTDLYQPRHRL